MKRKVKKRIAVISRDKYGVTKELNLVSFDGEPPVLDLRRYVNGDPRRGISLTDGEAVLLLQALRRVYEVAPHP